MDKTSKPRAPAPEPDRRPPLADERIVDGGPAPPMEALVPDALPESARIERQNDLA